LAKTSDPTRLESALTALRGVVLLIAGAFTLAYPAEALRFLVFVGGGLLLVDGVLNLATIRFDQPRDMSFWVGVIRSGLAILAGLAVLLSPWLASILSVPFLLYFVGVQAIAVGIIEIVELVVPERKPFSHVWPALISGGTYALFGLALILLPLSGAIALARLVAVLAIVFALSLFFRVWSQRAKAGTPGY
jgi:Uncharacterized conserved protein